MDWIHIQFFNFEIWQIGLLVVIGAFAGFINVLAGGGSLLALPIMNFMGIESPFNNGTNRVVLFAQNISGTISYF